MYSKKVTSANIDKVSEKIGFTLTPHSVDEVSRHNKRLNQLLGDDGRLVRGLSTEEMQWCLNERLLCRLDFRYFLSRYCFIRNWEGRLIRFPANVAQEIVIDIWADLEEQGRAISIQQLKARQLGVSTITELAVAHRVQFYRQVNAVVASSQPTKSAKMAEMMERCWQNQPWWLLPSQSKYISGELIEFGEMNSAVSIQHGSQFTGIARGDTPTVAHLCLSPNTLIHLANGTVKPISEVAPNDQVITSRGKLERVRAAWKSPRKNELTSEIWLWGNFAPLSCTRDHPVMSERGWTEACKVLAGDFVRVPVRPISKEKEDFTITVLPHGKTHNKAQSRTFPLDFHWGWLCGLYLAEGTVLLDSRHGYTTGVCFSVSVDEQKEFTTKLALAVGGEQYVGVRRSNSKTRILCIHDSMLGRWIHEHFGRKDSKRVPDWSWQAGKEFCRGLLCGYLEGDGHIPNSKNDIPATSVRLQIPVQMRDLIASLGFGWSSIYFKPGGLRYGRHCLDSWNLYIQGPTAQALRKDMGWPSVGSGEAKHWRYVADSPFIEVEVDRNLDGFSEEFYDLEVDSEEHDFCTLQCLVHNSELCEFINPEELVDASLLRAMHESPWLFLVLESTALGRQNWWHRTWEYSKQYWSSGMARLYPMFLPWFVGRDIYPSETWLRSRPVPYQWQPAQLTLHHAERAKAYVKSDDILRKFLGTDWEMPIEQMWWWEVNRQEYAAKKELPQFYSETPADDMEAFQSTNVSAFDSDTLTFYREQTKDPIGVFGFVGRGDQIPVRMQPDRRDIDPNMPPINIRARWNPSIEPFECQLVPLRFHGYPNTDPHGKLFMWEMPEENETYGVGVDTGDGVGLDRSAIEVLRKGTLERNDAQVAEFVNPYINAFDLWSVCMAVGTLYSPPVDGYHRQAKMVIDCLKNGESTQWELRKNGWTNFHIWMRYDSKKVRQAQAHKLGWFANSWARAMMMDYAIKALRDEFVDVNSPYFVNEMADLERDEFRQSLKAVFGGHDDCFVAFGQVFISLHIMEIRSGSASMAQRRVALKETNQLDPVYRHQWQADDTPRSWATRDELEGLALLIDTESD